KALPAIGFSSGAQVSLGLKLLVGETSAEEFQGIIHDVQKRMEAELEAIFSASGLFSIERRIELVNQVQSYSYQGHGVDLTTEAKTKLQEKLLKVTEYAISRLEFDMALARGRQDDKTSSLLREIKLLLSQKQFPQLL